MSLKFEDISYQRKVCATSCSPGWPRFYYVTEAGFEFLSLLLQPPNAYIMGMYHYAGLNVKDECVCGERRGGEGQDKGLEGRGKERGEEEKVDEEGNRKIKEDEPNRNIDQCTCESLLISDAAWVRREYQYKWRSLKKKMLYEKDHMKLNL